MIATAVAFFAAAGPAAAATCKSSWTDDSSATPPEWLAHTSALSATDVWGVPWNNTITHWNGNAWSTVPFSGPTGAQIRAVDPLSPTAGWAVGGVRQAGIADQPLIARWNGTAWTSVPTPAFSGMLWAVDARSSDDAWAVGQGAPGAPLPILHWDGSAWTQVAAPTAAVGDYLGDVVAVAPDDAWATGEDVVVHWDGTSWQRMDPPGGGWFSAVAATSPKDVWVVGDRVAHWDGSTWTVTTLPPVPGFGDVTLWDVAPVSANDVWAVGSTDTGGDNQVFQRVLLHWDGFAWTPVRPDVQRGWLHAVSVLGGGQLLAAGTAVTRLCEAQLTDSGFAPNAIRGLAIGTTAVWHLAGTNRSRHGIRDATGLGLFDSGLRDAGGSFTFDFPAAGGYDVVDPATGARGLVTVGLGGSPATGTTATAFKLRWAAAPLTGGRVADVHVLRPDVPGYADVYSGSAPGLTFVPDGGPGLYEFQARLRDPATGATSQWSTVRAFIVTAG